MLWPCARYGTVISLNAVLIILGVAGTTPPFHDCLRDNRMPGAHGEAAAAAQEACAEAWTFSSDWVMTEPAMCMHS